jgi:hypothetical protein
VLNALSKAQTLDIINSGALEGEGIDMSELRNKDSPVSKALEIWSAKPGGGRRFQLITVGSVPPPLVTRLRTALMQMQSERYFESLLPTGVGLSDLHQKSRGLVAKFISSSEDLKKCIDNIGAEKARAEQQRLEKELGHDIFEDGDVSEEREGEYEKLYKSVLCTRNASYIPVPHKLENNALIAALRETHAKMDSERCRARRTKSFEAPSPEMRVAGDSELVTVVVHDFTSGYPYSQRGYPSQARFNKATHEGMAPMTVVLLKAVLTSTWSCLVDIITEKLLLLDDDDDSVESSGEEDRDSRTTARSQWLDSYSSRFFHGRFQLELLKEPPVEGKLVVAPIQAYRLLGEGLVGNLLSEHIVSKNEDEASGMSRIFHVNLSMSRTVAGKPKLAPQEMASQVLAVHKLVQAMPRLLDCVLLQAKLCSRQEVIGDGVGSLLIDEGWVVDEAQKLIQIYTNTDYCFVAFCTDPNHQKTHFGLPSCNMVLNALY